MSSLFDGTTGRVVIQDAPESSWGPLQLMVNKRRGTSQTALFGPVSLILGYVRHSGGWLRDVSFFVPRRDKNFSLKLEGEPANPIFVLVDERGNRFEETIPL